MFRCDDRLTFAQEGSYFETGLLYNFRNIVGPSLQSPEPDGRFMKHYLNVILGTLFSSVGNLFVLSRCEIGVRQQCAACKPTTQVE
jgi:hypothetical protein